jgi:hypothetical protein
MRGWFFIQGHLGCVVTTTVVSMLILRARDHVLRLQVE